MHTLAFALSIMLASIALAAQPEGADGATRTDVDLYVIRQLSPGALEARTILVAPGIVAAPLLDIIGAERIELVDPESDERRNYRCVVDASGDPNILDTAISRLAPGGIVILAGFYSQPLSFQFPPAFLKEAQIRVAAQWQPEDMQCVLELVRADRLSLAGLVTHHEPAANAGAAYRTAFEDPACLKMVLDWRSVA